MTTELDRLNEFLSDRYRLQRELGRGGMATVYLAQDLRHERPVAIKVMNAELSASLGTERFLREIKLTARLNHPHILPLLDSGEADGSVYYVMPYVNGESVRSRLDREKQLPLGDALQIAREVADALDYAHREAVVHRDIKPENILVSAGHAVVADFGIAKAISAAGGEKLTRTGLAIGTPAYMSPEQAASSQDLDGRSDLYSLGCVLFEMLAGEPPFTGPTAASVIHQHQVATPPAVTNIRPAVPEHVATALTRALAKTPADRFTPVARFRDALEGPDPADVPSAARDSTRFGKAIRWQLRRTWVAALIILAGVGTLAGLAWRGRTSAGPNRLVVVMPFENRTGDPSLDDLGALAANWLGDAILRDGVAEAVPPTVVHDLLRTDLRGSARPVEDLARRTGARTAIAGEYRRNGNQIEIRGVLLSMPGAKPLIALDPVIGAAAGNTLLPALELRVLEAVQSRFEAAQVPRSYSRPSSVEAYREFIRGEQLFIGGNYIQAAEHHARAAALDTGWVTPTLYLAFSLDAAGRTAEAVRLERRLEQRRSRLPPWDANMLTLVQSQRAGDLSSSYQAAKRLFEQAPRHWGGVNFAAAALFMNRPEEALRVARLRDTSTAIGRQLSFWGTLETSSLHLMGRYQEELEAALDERRRFPGDPQIRNLEIRARAALNQTGDIARLLDETIGRQLRWNDGPGLAYSELLAHGHDASARALLPRVLKAYETLATQPGASRKDSLAFAAALIAARDYARARLLCTALRPGADGAAEHCLVYLDACEGDRDRALRESAKWHTSGPLAIPGQSTYWRAQVVAALGDGPRAVALLRQAFAEGYAFVPEIHRDIYLAKIWTDPGFREFLRPKG